MLHKTLNSLWKWCSDKGMFAEMLIGLAWPQIKVKSEENNRGELCAEKR